jgi:hypothetical protein
MEKSTCLKFHTVTDHISTCNRLTSNRRLFCCGGKYAKQHLILSDFSRFSVRQWDEPWSETYNLGQCRSAQTRRALIVENRVR